MNVRLCIVVMIVGGLLQLSAADSDYKKKCAEYQKIIDSPANGPWGFEQQQAKEKLAALHAENKNYKDAIKVLESWKVKEPCGNGRACTDTRRQFRILQYSLHIKKKEAVRKEMWNKVKSASFGFGFMRNEEMAKYFLSLYEGETKQLLRDLEACKSELGDSDTHKYARNDIKDFEPVLRKVIAAL